MFQLLIKGLLIVLTFWAPLFCLVSASCSPYFLTFFIFFFIFFFTFLHERFVVTINHPSFAHQPKTKQIIKMLRSLGTFPVSLLSSSSLKHQLRHVSFYMYLYLFFVVEVIEPNTKYGCSHAHIHELSCASEKQWRVDSSRIIFAVSLEIVRICIGLDVFPT